MKLEELLKELLEAKFPIHNEKGNLVMYLKITSVENAEDHGAILLSFDKMMLSTSTCERIVKYYKEYLEEQKDK